MSCKNLCFHDEDVCSNCKKNYIVSSDFYKAKRHADNGYSVGYLVRRKSGDIMGILDRNTDFHALIWIDENTLEKIES